MNFTVEGTSGTAAVCIPILRSLPEWLGIEEAIVHFSSEIDRMPTFLACNSEQVVGFQSVKTTSQPYSAEVYVMGNQPEAHRRGIGRGSWMRHKCG